MKPLRRQLEDLEHVRRRGGINGTRESKLERQDQSDPDEGREKKKTGVVKIYGSCRNKMDSWENPSKT